MSEKGKEQKIIEVLKAYEAGEWILRTHISTKQQIKFKKDGSHSDAWNFENYSYEAICGEIRIEFSEQTVYVYGDEAYAGIILHQTGKPRHHIVVKSKNKHGPITWNEARISLHSIPTIQELSLIFTNCRHLLKDNEWYWSSESASGINQAFVMNGGNGLIATQGVNRAAHVLYVSRAAC